jgi:hypothetical protein
MHPTGSVFQAWRVLRVTFKTDARNSVSRRAIERLGAQFEGVRRAHSPARDGTVRDSAYYSITAPEWPAVQSRRRPLEQLDGRRPGRSARSAAGGTAPRSCAPERSWPG